MSNGQHVKKLNWPVIHLPTKKVICAQSGFPPFHLNLCQHCSFLIELEIYSQRNFNFDCQNTTEFVLNKLFFMENSPIGPHEIYRYLVRVLKDPSIIPRLESRVYVRHLWNNSLFLSFFPIKVILEKSLYMTQGNVK